jgi:hypothetical protein
LFHLRPLQTFFNVSDGRTRPNKNIDTTLLKALFDLLGQPQTTPTSLASRNMLRGLTKGAPSGQRVAECIGGIRGRMMTPPAEARSADAPALDDRSLVPNTAP